MQAAGIPALAISLAALAVSLYGIAERRGASRRAERLRFVTLIDELNTLRLEHLLPHGDAADAVNARAELLAIQAFTLQRRLTDITSPEYRALAYALSRSGYPAEADQAWRAAIDAAEDEGPVQTLFARRGYAFFLFTAGRVEKARDEMGLAIEAIGSADDTARVHQIKTFKYWANDERAANRTGGRAEELLKRAEQAVTLLESEHTRRRMRSFLENAEG
ncbi:hypothetical protein ACIA5D_26445 [Actinoplanes sp. NPDC051513]|uniref:hypothetical protein n=1 Tax=Actinoplanes sp. NPDC051513 TaxID=3363908 RepID=UPI00378B49A8